MCERKSGHYIKAEIQGYTFTLQLARRFLSCLVLFRQVTDHTLGPSIIHQKHTLKPLVRVWNSLNKAEHADGSLAGTLNGFESHSCDGIKASVSPEEQTEIF